MARLLHDQVLNFSWAVSDLDSHLSTELPMPCANVLSLSCGDIDGARQTLRRFQENLCAIIDALHADLHKQDGDNSSPFASWSQTEKQIAALDVAMVIVQLATAPFMTFFSPVLPLSDPRFGTFLEDFQGVDLVWHKTGFQAIPADLAIEGLLKAIHEFLACQKDAIAKLENPELEISQAEAFTSVMDLTTSMQSVFFAVNALRDLLAHCPGAEEYVWTIFDNCRSFFDGIRFIQENVFEKLPTFDVVGSEENLSPRDWLAEQHRGILHVFLTSTPYRELRTFLDKLTTELDSQD